MLKLYKFLKPYTAMIAGILVLVFIQTIGDLYLPTLMADIINKGVMNGNTEKIIEIGSTMLMVTAISIISAIIASYLSAKASVGLGTILRSKVFKRVESFSLNEFDKIGTATLITRTTNDITQIQTVTMMIMRMMIAAPMMAIGGIILASGKDKPLTIVFAVSIPVLGLVIGLLASKMIPLFRKVQVKIDNVNLVLREKLTGIRVIRAFDTVDRENARFNKANFELTDNYIKVNRIMAFMMPSIMLIMNLTALSILWFGGLQISNNITDLGALSAFLQYAMQIMFAMIMLAMMFIMVPRAQAAAVRINAVLDTHPDIVDPPESDVVFEGRGNIEFKNVSFRYHGAEESALKNVSFSAKAGEVTAIIGSTGAGKTTLVNLIPRFYDVASGNILIDGVDIREISQHSLRGKIGFVPQKSVLFSGSITSNLKFGNENATEEAVQKAAETAQAMEFISENENGFEHEISQGGTNISGGQKQRLSIARALVKKPEVYIFDDSFSALDFKTDSELRKALRKEVTDATIIIVAQRVGTVMSADRIIVLDDGEVRGMGTHKDLLKSCDVYREIVASQMTEEEIA
jgi:ATP-binding cassette subfamily B multidrug efflux pump